MSWIDGVLIALVAAAVGFAVRSMIRTRRRGGCAACPYAGSCMHGNSTSCEVHHG